MKLHLFTPASLVAALLMCFSAASQAQTEPQGSPECGVRIATGPESGVYARLAKDIKAVCGKVVNVCSIPSSGGLQNLTMLSASEADVGFAQVDLMTDSSLTADPNIRQLLALMPMHSNLLHVVTLKSGTPVLKNGINPFNLTEARTFSKFSDLRGARVALVGSAVLMGQSLERQLHYGMTFVEADSESEAFSLLRKYRVHAVFVTGGWPYKPIAKQESGGDLMLAQADIKVPSPLTTVVHNYPNLGAYGMSFIASPNLMITRPFKAGGEKARQVDALRRCIKSRMDDLQEGDYSPAWQEIKDASDTMGVAVFKAQSSETAKASNRN